MSPELHLFEEPHFMTQDETRLNDINIAFKLPCRRSNMDYPKLPQLLINPLVS